MQKKKSRLTPEEKEAVYVQRYLQELEEQRQAFLQKWREENQLPIGSPRGHARKGGDAAAAKAQEEERAGSVAIESTPAAASATSGSFFRVRFQQRNRQQKATVI